eukprot:gene10720-10527_t
MKKLEGKVALVTGSGRGIGRSVALQLAGYGAKVVVNDLDAGPAEDVVTEIRAAGGDAVACVGSVTAADFAERFVKTAVESFGGVDIIINNAGYTWDSVIQKMTDEQWYAIIDCHLTAPFRILRAAQPVISAQAKKEATEGREVFRKSKTVTIEGREIKVGVQKAMIDGASQVIPLGRPGTPEEAAGSVVMLCLPEANYVSGQTLVCGGGHGAL